MKWIQWWDEFILQWMWWVEINNFYLAPVHTIVNVGIQRWNSIIYIIIYRSVRFQSPNLEIWFTSHASMCFKSTIKPEIPRWSAFHILPSVKWPSTCGWVINDHVYIYLHVTFGEMKKKPDTFTWFRHGMLLFYFPTCRVVQNVH